MDTAFHTEVHVELIAFTTVVIVFLIPLIIGVKKLTIPFHTVDHNDCINVNEVFHTLIMIDSTFCNNVLIDSRVEEKNQRLISNAPCQSPCRSFITVTTMVRTRFTPTLTIVCNVYQTTSTKAMIDSNIVCTKPVVLSDHPVNRLVIEEKILSTPSNSC